MDQPGWTRLLGVEECPPGRAKFISVVGHELAVFHLTEPDRFVVTPNACPHAGGSLAAGDLGRHTITCPWHAWTFDLDTGTCPMAELVRLRFYESRIIDGILFARLPDPGPDENALML